MFDTLTTDASIQSDGDNLGGSRYGTLDSAIYPFDIKLAYGSISNGGAKALNLVLETEDGKELKAQLWLTSATAKGGQNFYMAKDPKTGQKTIKKYLPGFELADHLCLMTLGKHIAQVKPETKTIMLYDFSQRKEVPTEVPMVTELLGKKIFAGVIKQTVSKRVKDANGNYVDSTETRDENEIDKFFHYPSGLTVTEAEAKMTEPVFKGQWDEKWTGQVKDKTSKTAVNVNTGSGNSGTFGGGTTTPKQADNDASIFDDAED